MPIVEEPLSDEPNDDEEDITVASCHLRHKPTQVQHEYQIYRPAGYNHLLSLTDGNIQNDLSGEEAPHEDDTLAFETTSRGGQLFSQL